MRQNEMYKICYRGVKEALIQARTRLIKYKEQGAEAVFIETTKCDIIEYNNALAWLEKEIGKYEKIMQDTTPGYEGDGK